MICYRIETFLLGLLVYSVQPLLGSAQETAEENLPECTREQKLAVRDAFISTQTDNLLGICTRQSYIPVLDIFFKLEEEDTHRINCNRDCQTFFRDMTSDSLLKKIADGQRKSDERITVEEIGSE